MEFVLGSSWQPLCRFSTRYTPGSALRYFRYERNLSHAETLDLVS